MFKVGDLVQVYGRLGRVASINDKVMNILLPATDEESETEVNLHPSGRLYEHAHELLVAKLSDAEQYVIDENAFLSTRNIGSLDLSVTQAPNPAQTTPEPEVPTLAAMERLHIESTLKNLKFDYKKSADVLGITHKTLKMKMVDHGISRNK